MTDRRTFVGGSEVAALFGVHPYLSKYELWMQKAGRLEPKDISKESYIKAGLYLQDGVAAWAAGEQDWTIVRGPDAPIIHPTIPGAGRTPDYYIEADVDRGRGVLEVKTTDLWMAKQWDEADDPPLHWQLQLQDYIGQEGLTWGALAVLVGGNQLRIFPFNARPATFELLVRARREFWESIAADKPPAPDWAADAEAIERMNRAVNANRSIDMSQDNRLNELVTEYHTAHSMADEAKSRMDAAKAEILTKVGDAAVVTCNAHVIKFSHVAGKPDRVVTQEMVGKVIAGRESHRRMFIKQRKQ